MTRFTLAFVLTVLTALAGAACGTAEAGAIGDKMKIWSPDVAVGQTIGDTFVFNDFGCTGKNVSPTLKWSGAPAGTKSFAVTLYDPDAPTGSGWWHWIVYNIPPDTSSLAQGAGDPKSPKLPAGAVQSRTDFGQEGYGGPCPPVGDKPHHYIFTVYALKVGKIDAMPDMSGAMVGYSLHANTLDKASFTARYGRIK